MYIQTSLPGNGYQRCSKSWASSRSTHMTGFSKWWLVGDETSQCTKITFATSSYLMGPTRWSPRCRLMSSATSDSSRTTSGPRFGMTASWASGASATCMVKISRRSCSRWRPVSSPVASSCSWSQYSAKCLRKTRKRSPKNRRRWRPGREDGTSSCSNSSTYSSWSPRSTSSRTSSSPTSWCSYFRLAQPSDTDDVSAWWHHSIDFIQHDKWHCFQSNRTRSAFITFIWPFYFIDRRTAPFHLTATLLLLYSLYFMFFFTF